MVKICIVVLTPRILSEKQKVPIEIANKFLKKEA